MLSTAPPAMMIGTDTKARNQFADQLEHYRHHLKELVFSRTAELAESRNAADAAPAASSACSWDHGPRTGHADERHHEHDTCPLPKRSANGMPPSRGGPSSFRVETDTHNLWS